MAFQKNYTDPTTQANYAQSYWKPRIVTFDLARAICTVEMWGWATEAAQQNGAQPTMKQTLTLQGAAYIDVLTAARPACPSIAPSYSGSNTPPPSYNGQTPIPTIPQLPAESNGASLDGILGYALLNLPPDPVTGTTFLSDATYVGD